MELCIDRWAHYNLLVHNHKKIDVLYPEFFPESLVQFKLTAREIAIIKEMSKGSTYQQIGDTLYISINTVRTHVSNIYKKCGIKNKVELLQLLNLKKSETSK